MLQKCDVWNKVMCTWVKESERQSNTEGPSVLFYMIVFGLYTEIQYYAKILPVFHMLFLTAASSLFSFFLFTFNEQNTEVEYFFRLL